MARMIPLHIPVKTESAAERKLFDEFEHGCPSDWIVLHSLDLARRGTGPFGEADFVVIAPGYGILCVEAKTYLSRTAGRSLAHVAHGPAAGAQSVPAGRRRDAPDHGLDPRPQHAGRALGIDRGSARHRGGQQGPHRLGALAAGRPLAVPRQELRAHRLRRLRLRSAPSSRTRRHRSRRCRPSGSCRSCARKSSAT